MKILLLLILIILLARNVINTPAYISKKIWLRNKDKIISKDSNYNKKIPMEYKRDIELAKLTIIIPSTISYIILGTIIGTSFSAVLSVIEIVVSARCICSVDINASDIFDINVYKYHRLDNLLKMVVNYVYYTYAIYMLLK